MKQFLITLFVLVTSQQVFSQQFEWVKRLGGTHSIEPESIVISPSGDMVISGTFKGNVDFDPGLNVYELSTGETINDIFILKLSSDGDFLWAKSFEGEWSEPFGDISVDNEDNIYLTGGFREPVDFDPSSNQYVISPVGNYGDDNSFVCKLNGFGELVWVFQLGDWSSDVFTTSILADNDGGFYLGGYFEGGIDFDPSSSSTALGSNGKEDAFICKYDENGNFEWASSYGDTEDDRINSIAIDGIGGIYTAGFFTDSVDFDSDETDEYWLSTTGFHDKDAVVVKLDIVGNFEWASHFEGVYHDWANAIAADGAGNSYVAGTFKGAVDFNPDYLESNLLVSRSQEDGFIVKLDHNGGLIWAYQLASEHEPEINDLHLSPDNYLYSSGWDAGATDFQVNGGQYTLPRENYQDAFVFKQDTSGAFQWVKAFYSNLDLTGKSVVINSEGEVFTVGRFRDTVDFDPGINEHVLVMDSPFWEGYIHKMSACEMSYSQHADSSCLGIQSPSGASFWDSTGVYIDIIPTVNGCDSLITVNLVVDDLQNVTDTTVERNAFGFGASLHNDSFQWLSCDNAMTEIIGATGSQFSPETNGSYSVEVTHLGCVDTSFCHSILNAALAESPKELAVTAYPNPTTDRVQINFGSISGYITFEVYDVTGNIIQTKALKSTASFSYQLPYTKGIYLMRLIYSDGKFDCLRIVKE